MKKNKAPIFLFKHFFEVCKMKAGLFLFLLLIGSLLHGCVTNEGPVLNYSLEDLDHVIRANLPGGVAHISENGRTYYGNYFDPFILDHKTNGPSDKRDFRRYRSVITLTGDRRPYDIEVIVNVDVRPRNIRMPASQKMDVNTGPFISRDSSPETGNKILHVIQKALKDHRQNSNVIDNFKPF